MTNCSLKHDGPLADMAWLVETAWGGNVDNTSSSMSAQNAGQREARRDPPDAILPPNLIEARFDERPAAATARTRRTMRPRIRRPHWHRRSRPNRRTWPSAAASSAPNAEQ